MAKEKKQQPVKPKSNAGRKELDDVKETVRLYIRTSVIEKNGGLEQTQDKCYDALGIKRNH